VKIAKTNMKNTKRIPKGQPKKGVFISWTKPLGLHLARQIRRFLESQLSGIDFFVSQDDLIPGQPWRHALGQRLRQDSFGILLITPAALTAPWIFYEAGALSAKANATVLPLLFGVSGDVLKEPIGGYQALSYSEEHMLRLIRILREAVGASASRTGKPKEFAKGWLQLNREVLRLLGQDLRTDKGPAGAGEYAFYMLNVKDPEEVHRGHLRLGMDGSNSLKACFRSYFDEYRGTWHMEGNLVSVELVSVKDRSDQLFFLLKRSGNWMWGVYCGLNASFRSVAGRCFLDGKRKLVSKLSTKKLTDFISLAQCNKETQHKQLGKVSDYLNLPIGPTLHCGEPVGY